MTADLQQMAQLWTREQVVAVVNIRDAWIELAEARRAYERILRTDAG